MPPHGSHSFLHTIYATETTAGTNERQQQNSLCFSLLVLFGVCVEKKDTHNFYECNFAYEKRLCMTSKCSITQEKQRRPSKNARRKLQIHENIKKNIATTKEKPESRSSGSGSSNHKTSLFVATNVRLCFFLMWYVFVAVVGFVWWKRRRWCYYTHTYIRIYYVVAVRWFVVFSQTERAQAPQCTGTWLETEKNFDALRFVVVANDKENNQI